MTPLQKEWDDKEERASTVKFVCKFYVQTKKLVNDGIQNEGT